MTQNIQTRIKKPTIYTLELETYLSNVQEKADKISDRFIIMFFVLGLCLAPVYDTWKFTLMTSIATVGLYSVARFVLTNKFTARMIISLVYSIFMLQFIGQMHGMAEVHFFFFINIALLIIYQDWRIMIPYTVFAIGHHSVLAILQANPDVFHLESIHLPNYFIGFGGRTFDGESVDNVTTFQLMFHFGLAAMMAFICGWWAIIFRNNSIQLMEKQLEQQAKNEELISSEEELKQNAEELQTTNNQMHAIQKEIEEKQKLLNKAEKLVGLASYEIDLVSQKLTHSDNLPLIYGEKKLDTMQEIIEIAHPEDVHKVIETLTQASKGEIQNYDISYRSKGKNFTEYKYYRAIGELVNDENNNPEKLVGTVQDITNEVKQQQQIEEAYQKVQSSEEELRQNYEELQTTQEELEKQKGNVERQSAYQKAILDNAALMFIVTDTTGIITSFNPAAEKGLGYSAQEVVGIESPALFHDINEIIEQAKELSEEFNEQIKVGFEVFTYKTLKGLSNIDEWTYTKKNKEKFTVNLTISAIHQNGEVIGFLGIAEDITERKNTEIIIKKQNEELQASEEELKQNYEELQTTQEELNLQKERLEQIFDGVPAMIYQFKLTPEGHMSFPVVSKGSEMAYGLPAQVIMNDASSIIASIHEDDKLRFQHTVGESAQNMTNWNEDLRTIINGKQQWIRGSAKPVKDKEGNIIWSGIVQEVTQYKELEQEIQEKNENLQASEEELKQNLEELQTTQELVNNAFSELDAQFTAISATLGYAEISTDRKIERVNELFADWLGYSVEELQDKSHFSFIPNTQEDKTNYEKLWQNLEAGNTYSDVFKRVNKNGEEIWLYGSYCPVKDENGKITKIIKIVSNYNEQKKSQKNLQQLSLVASKTDNAVIITDQNGIIEWVNEGFTKVSEYSFEEAIGKKPSTLLQREGTSKEQISTIRKGLDSLKPFTQEIYNYSKSGRGYWLELNITPVFDEKNELVNFIAIESDITERKEIELKIRENNNALLASEEELKQNFEELQTTQEQLQQQKEEVEKAFLELQNTQSQLIQSEKMASLGQLVANIAHEINTPLGAIRSSAISIEEILNETLPTLPSFLKKLDDHTLTLFNEFVALSSQKSDTLSSREKRAIKYELIEEFDELGLKNTDEYADWIVDMNMYQEKELFTPLLKNENAKDILQIAYQLSTIVRSNRTVKTATDRAAKIVFALKNFARQDHTGEKSVVNINESIEVTLTLYHNQIKHGIDVTRDLGEIPEFMGYPDQLVQVWTNIIHNAIQAMKNKGRLFIQTTTEKNNVLISIQDNGGGIPKEAQERVFDAFFTTKSAGEGSGLGLDITKKIIEKHNGKIWFETLEGIGTTFFIQLPLNQ